MNKDKTIEQVERWIDACLEASEVLSGGYGSSDAKWHVARYREYVRALFDRTPIKKGARVRLLRTPEISSVSRWGWLGCRHFLVAGAMATVDAVDFHDGQFSAGLIFDDESWLPYEGPNKGIPQPIDRPSQFWFSETWFEVVDDEKRATP